MLASIEGWLFGWKVSQPYEEKAAICFNNGGVKDFMWFYNTTDMKKVAQHVRTNPYIFASALGNALRSNQLFLEAYVASFDVTDKSFLDAFRIYLETFHPSCGGVEHCNRYTCAFAKWYWDTTQHSDKKFFKTENAMSNLAFEFLRLNASLHSPRAPLRPDVKFFVEHLKGENEKEDFDLSFLESVYHAIESNEFMCVRAMYDKKL